jgi:hypothetical protein
LTSIQEACTASGIPLEQLEIFLLKTAPSFDVHKWSEFPEINLVINNLFEEIKVLRHSRGERIRGSDKVKRSIKVIVMDLWAAAKVSVNPYRYISKNKSDFAKETRYKKIFCKYDYFVGAINDLVALGYIHENLGYRYEANAKRTRIKALPKLIDEILKPPYGVAGLIVSKGNMALVQYNPDLEMETIFLRDAEKNNVDYEDTDITRLMRKNLKAINDRLCQDRITLHITNSQYKEMLQELSSKKNPKPSVDFTRNGLHRVFNNSSFEDGGRFYGGWWLNIPKDYRKYIEIGRKPTVELDYSGHHFRILYAMESLTPPDDPYDLPDFKREDQKTAGMIIINASDEGAAAHAIQSEGIQNVKRLIKALKVHHAPIAKYFFTGEGNKLMHKDSILAERVMLRMLESGSTILPVHDSFIVRNSYETELEEIMQEEYERAFASTAKLKVKRTALQATSEDSESQHPHEATIVNMNLKTLIQNLQEYSWETSIWGV